MPSVGKREKPAKTYNLRHRPGTQVATSNNDLNAPDDLVNNNSSNLDLSGDNNIYNKASRRHVTSESMSVEDDNCNEDVTDSDSVSSMSAVQVENSLKTQRFFSCLSCQWCLSPFKSDNSSCSPVQLKPCNHLVCFSCVQSMLQMAFEASLTAKTLICQKKNCSKRIIKMSLNKAVVRILNEFREHDVKVFACDETDRLCPLSLKKLQLLTDFTISKKSIEAFNEVTENDIGPQNAQSDQATVSSGESDRAGGESDNSPGVARSSSRRNEPSVLSRIRRNAFGSFMENLDFVTFD